MKIKIDNNNNIYSIDSQSGVDISIPMKFNDNQNPKFYDLSNPVKRYYKSGDNEYSLNKGGGCNVPMIKLNVHCMGTHTESANHISKDGTTINMINNLNFIPAQLITIKPETKTNESYHTLIDNSDKLITKSLLKNAIDSDNDFLDSIIIRTLPNGKEKKKMNYNNNPHPFLTTDAIIFLNDIGVEHILIDTPSIDKYDDEGKLGNHHMFFNNKNYNTITELIYVPSSCEDGKYFLSIGIPNFNLDAAPSRPIIYKIIINDV